MLHEASILHPQPGFLLSTAPSLCQHPLALSTDTDLPRLPWSCCHRSSPSLQAIAAPAPSNRGQLSVAESIPDIHHFGDSHSQTGSDGVQKKKLRCSSEASTLPCGALTGTKITWSKVRVNFLETPSERRHGLAEWQLPGRQVPNSCFLLAHDLEGLAVLLPPRPSPPPAPPAHLIYYGCKSSAASPLSLCLHSTLCSGSYRCCWNINSNTALIINPAGRWTAQA